MSKSLTERLLVASAALALAACGGGGGGSSSAGLISTPPPPPPATQTCANGTVIPITSTCPPPPPPPSPPPSPTIFAGITTNTNFAVLGLEASDKNIPASSLARDGFTVRYDAATQGYFMDLPSTDEFRFNNFGETSSFWSAFIATGFYSGTILDIFKPSQTNPEIQLAYTSFGISSGYYTTPFGFFAFGIPTPASGVPISGTATYDAHVAGGTMNSFASIGGDATLQFNFGAGTLSGQFDPVHQLNGVNTSLGRYSFLDTVFGVGSTNFSGSLSHSGLSTLGAFDGRFTGPAAQELMARWTAPYLPPGSQQPAEMFGVWVGKRP